MEPRTGEDSQTFNLLLNPELKEQVSYLSAQLGLSQRELIEWAIRVYIAQEKIRTIRATPRAFLQRLVRLHTN